MLSWWRLLRVNSRFFYCNCGNAERLAESHLVIKKDSCLARYKSVCTESLFEAKRIILHRVGATLLVRLKIFGENVHDWSESAACGIYRTVQVQPC